MSSYTQLAVVNLQAGMLQFSMWAPSGDELRLTHILKLLLQPQPERGQLTQRRVSSPACTFSHLRMDHWPKQGASKLGFQERERTSLLDEKSSDVTSLRSIGGMPHHIFTKSLPWEPQLPPTGPGNPPLFRLLLGPK